MQGAAERGETPVPDLANLDVYYEIGAELLAEHIVPVDDDSYRARYREKLAAWHAFSPIPPDRRLWNREDATP